MLDITTQIRRYSRRGKRRRRKKENRVDKREREKRVEVRERESGYRRVGRKNESNSRQRRFSISNKHFSFFFFRKKIYI